jgi:hypothetical protein
MRRVFGAIVLLGVLAPGCFESSHTSDSIPPHGISAKTSVVFTFAVGVPMANRSNVARCPRHATCSVNRVPQTPTRWIRVARRKIYCEPDIGNYTDGKAACQALTNLVAYLQAPRDAQCLCAMLLPPPYKIDGFVQNKPVRFRFDWCRLCGGPISAHTALQHLLSQS